MITAEMVASMKRGSVIVDMAAANGGNVEGTVAGEVVVTANGVTIIGYTDLPGRLAAQASQLFSTNLVNLMKLMTPGKDGVLVIDWDDVVQRGITVARDGEVTWPPPAVQVSAAPTQAAAEQAVVEAPPAKAPMTTARRFTYVGIGAALLLLLVAASPPSFRVHLTVFRPGNRDRVLRDRQRASRIAHAADVSYQRDLRHHRRRRAPSDRSQQHRDYGLSLRRSPTGQH